MKIIKLIPQVLLILLLIINSIVPIHATQFVIVNDTGSTPSGKSGYDFAKTTGKMLLGGKYLELYFDSAHGKMYVKAPEGNLTYGSLSKYYSTDTATTSTPDKVFVTIANSLTNQAKNLLLGIDALAILTCLLLIIYFLLKLSTSSSNDTKRSEAISGLLYTSIVTAVLGSVTFIYFALILI